jgi:hypothetical protein
MPKRRTLERCSQCGLARVRDALGFRYFAWASARDALIQIPVAGVPSLRFAPDECPPFSPLAPSVS